MIDRYSRKEMAGLWSASAKFYGWLEVELAAIQARIDRDEIPCILPEGLISRVNIVPEEIDRIEKDITKHDVIAFLMHVSPQLPEELRPWLHHRMTSYDAQDTALFLALVRSVDILIGDIEHLMGILRRRAFEFRDTPMIGRTHGIHAEPITFGRKLALWYDELRRHRNRLAQVRENLSVGKISGAVGMFTLDPVVEKAICEQLGVRPIMATQIIARDLITEYAGVMANIAGSLGNFATQIRTLARTEIREVMEFFDKNQRGSSAMPHKKNPIGGENVTSICRHIVSCFFTAAQNQITWDERDLANSASERIILPDMTIGLDYALHRFAGVMEKLLVFPDQMMFNLNLTKGLVYSQEVQALVAEKSGLPREDAYAFVRDVALRCWESNYTLDFEAELAKEPEIMRHVKRDELTGCFDLQEKLKHTGHIFVQIFGEAICLAN